MSIKTPAGCKLAGRPCYANGTMLMLIKLLPSYFDCHIAINTHFSLRHFYTKVIIVFNMQT